MSIMLPQDMALQNLFCITVGVSLLLAPAGADERGPKTSFPLVENVGIQPAIRKRVPAGALAGQELGLTESTDHILTLSQYCCMEQKHGGQDKTSIKMIQTVEQGSHGGLIVPLSPDQAAQVRALTWHIVLCS